MGQGQTVTYTLRVANHGEAAASEVKALVSAYYALFLPGGTCLGVGLGVGLKSDPTPSLGTVTW